MVQRCEHHGKKHRNTWKDQCRRPSVGCVRVIKSDDVREEWVKVSKDGHELLQFRGQQILALISNEEKDQGCALFLTQRPCFFPQFVNGFIKITLTYCKRTFASKDSQ